MTLAPPGDLTGKVAIVTGGCQGIGLAIAQRLAAEGARVVIAARRPAARRAATGIVVNGGEAIAISADVRSSTDVDALVDAAVDHYGALDIVVNNAGVSTRRAAPEEFPEAEIDTILETNLKGAYVISGVKRRLRP